MTGLIRLLMAPFIIFASLYVALFGTIYNELGGFANHPLELALLSEFDNKLSFQEATPFLTFTEIGIKISGIKEFTKGHEITHQEPLYISFNPWSFKAKACYKGKSNITSMSDASDNKEVDSDISLIFNMEYDYNVGMALINNDPAKVLNYIKSIIVEYNFITIHSAKTKSNIFEAKNTKLMLITRHDTYSEISDLLTNPPKYYSISGIVNISKSVNERQVVPSSIIYGIIPNFDITGPFFIEIDSHAKKFDFNKPFENSKTRFICDKCTSSTINLDIKSEIEMQDARLTMDVTSSLTFKKQFFESMPFWYKKIIKKIEKYDYQTAKFLISPEKTLPPIDYDASIIISTKNNLNITDEKIEAVINNLILRSSTGSGIMIHGNANLTSDFAYNLDVGVVLSNAENFLNYWGDYFYKIFSNPRTIDNEFVDFNKQVNFMTAKKISEYPTSASNDLMFMLSANSKQNEFLVSGKKSTDLLLAYYQIKSKKLLENAAQATNPLEYIKRVTPELAPLAEDLIKELPKDIKVSKELWQKLTK